MLKVVEVRVYLDGCGQRDVQGSHKEGMTGESPLVGCGRLRKYRRLRDLCDFGVFPIAAGEGFLWVLFMSAAFLARCGWFPRF